MAVLFLTSIKAQTVGDTLRPVRMETITPAHKNSFTDNGTNGTCKIRMQGGNPATVNGYFVFDGSADGDRQVDPQIAVGGGYILHGTNSGLFIYNKKGEFIQGVFQDCFKGGIDPKLFYDPHNKVFGFDMWVYWDKEKIKPVNIAVSQTDDPLGAWNTYSVSIPNGVDGGAVGYSHKWIGYSYPGGGEETFVLKMADAKRGKPAEVFHFPGSLGHPVNAQDGTDDLYFFDITGQHFIIRKVIELPDGTPASVIVANTPHHLRNFDWPPQSAQKDTAQKVSSGDRNPKNLILQNGSIWFSQAIKYHKRSAVQWHQVNAATGALLQSGLISNDTSNYIQTTIAVNKNNDVLIGFQEVNEHMYISPRFAYRYAGDAPGTIREMVHIGEGTGKTGGPAWGDYSCSVVDGDNFTDLWTIQSLSNEKGKGATKIARFSPEERKR